MMFVRICTGLVVLLLGAVSAQSAARDTTSLPAGAMRLLDLTGDGLLDRLQLGPDGALIVEVNRGARRFHAIHQELPRVEVTAVLAGDLDRDGLIDLYLVSPGPDVALVGDGSGWFREATQALGLLEMGVGLGAMRQDVDGDGLADLLLRNATRDVLFWARADGTYEQTHDGAGLSGAGAHAPLLPGVAVGGPPGAPIGAGEANDGIGATDASPAGAALGGTSASMHASGAALAPAPEPSSPAGAGIQPSPGTPDQDVGRSASQGLGNQLDARYVNDDAGEVDAADVVDGSLTGADVSTSTGDVAHTGGSVGIGTSTPSESLHVIGTVRAEAADFGSPAPIKSAVFGWGSLQADEYTEYGGTGVYGLGGETISVGRGGTGVIGRGGPGVYDRGFGVQGIGYPGVRGDDLFSVFGGMGVFGQSDSYGTGVYGINTNGVGGAGIKGISQGAGHGVYGVGRTAAYAGVYGQIDDAGSTAPAVMGRTYSATGYGVLSLGASGTTGQKNFLQPHPSDPSKVIAFTSLEGNESGTYFRGKTWLSGGVAVVSVPEAFRLVTAPDDLSVQLTASAGARVWFDAYDLDAIVIRGDADVEVHYMVNGIRRGFDSNRTLRDNRVFVPRYRGVPFATEYPEELRRILVANGTLNADFTPNEATAARLGWTLRDLDPDRPPKSHRAARRSWDATRAAPAPHQAFTRPAEPRR